MPAKKTEEVTHESLRATIVEKQKELDAAKAEYKQFCKDNPVEMPRQPTLHELRLMRQKNDNPTLLDHQKANLSAAQAVAREQLKQSIKDEN